MSDFGDESFLETRQAEKLVTIDEGKIDRLLAEYEDSRKYKALIVEAGLSLDVLYDVILGKQHVVIMDTEQQESWKQWQTWRSQDRQRKLRLDLVQLSAVTKQLEIRARLNPKTAVLQQCDIEGFNRACEEQKVTGEQVSQQISETMETLERRLRSVLSALEQGVVPLTARHLQLAPRSHAFSADDVAVGRTMMGFAAEKAKVLAKDHPVTSQTLAEAVYLGLTGTLKESVDFPEQGLDGLLRDYSAFTSKNNFLHDQMATIETWQQEAARAQDAADGPLLPTRAPQPQQQPGGTSNGCRPVSRSASPPRRVAATTAGKDDGKIPRSNTAPYLQRKPTSPTFKKDTDGSSTKAPAEDRRCNSGGHHPGTGSSAKAIPQPRRLSRRIFSRRRERNPLRQSRAPEASVPS